MKSYHKLIGGAVLFGVLLPVAALAQGLPGGASTLNETHGDWTVVCSAAEGPPRCVMSQTQVGGESRQRVLTVELRATEGDAVGGVLVLPFGLNLDDGVSLAIDDAASFGSLRFSTCLPVGCLVPLDFDAVRRQIIWLMFGRGLVERRLRPGFDVMRRACGAASADAGESGV